jgi:hypothetical protein
MDCPSCRCNKTEYHRDFGYWSCDLCACVWGNDDDDPDYDDCGEDEELDDYMELDELEHLIAVSRVFNDG